MLGRLVTRLRPASSRMVSSSTESYTERMNKTGRPLSPDVWPTWMYDASRGEWGGGFIYKMPTVAWTSIAMRGSGMVLWGAAAAAGTVALFDSQKPASFGSGIASSAAAPLAKLTFVSGQAARPASRHAPT